MSPQIGVWLGLAAVVLVQSGLPTVNCANTEKVVHQQNVEESKKATIGLPIESLFPFINLAVNYYRNSSVISSLERITNELLSPIESVFGTDTGASSLTNVLDTSQLTDNPLSDSSMGNSPTGNTLTNPLTGNIDSLTNNIPVNLLSGNSGSSLLTNNPLTDNTLNSLTSALSGLVANTLINNALADPLSGNSLMDSFPTNIGSNPTSDAFKREIPKAELNKIIEEAKLNPTASDAKLPGDDEWKVIRASESLELYSSSKQDEKTDNGTLTADSATQTADNSIQTADNSIQTADNVNQTDDNEKVKEAEIVELPTTSIGIINVLQESSIDKDNEASTFTNTEPIYEHSKQPSVNSLTDMTSAIASAASAQNNQSDNINDGTKGIETENIVEQSASVINTAEKEKTETDPSGGNPTDNASSSTLLADSFGGLTGTDPKLSDKREIPQSELTQEVVSATNQAMILFEPSSQVYNIGNNEQPFDNQPISNDGMLATPQESTIDQVPGALESEKVTDLPESPVSSDVPSTPAQPEVVQIIQEETNNVQNLQTLKENPSGEAALPLNDWLNILQNIAPVDNTPLAIDKVSTAEEQNIKGNEFTASDIIALLDNSFGAVNEHASDSKVSDKREIAATQLQSIQNVVNNDETLTPTQQLATLTPTQQVETLTPTQQLETLTPTQQLETLTPSQQLETLTPTQQLETLTPTQQLETLTPTQQLETLTPAQQLETLTPTQQLETLTPTQQLESLTPAQQLETLTPAQQQPAILTPTQQLETLTPALSPNIYQQSQYKTEDMLADDAPQSDAVNEFSNDNPVSYETETIQPNTFSYSSSTQLTELLHKLQTVYNITESELTKNFTSSEISLLLERSKINQPHEPLPADPTVVSTLESTQVQNYPQIFSESNDVNGVCYLSDDCDAKPINDKVARCVYTEPIIFIKKDDLDQAIQNEIVEFCTNMNAMPVIEIIESVSPCSKTPQSVVKIFEPCVEIAGNYLQKLNPIERLMSNPCTSCDSASEDVNTILTSQYVSFEDPDACSGFEPFAPPGFKIIGATTTTSSMFPFLNKERLFIDECGCAKEQDNQEPCSYLETSSSGCDIISNHTPTADEIPSLYVVDTFSPCSNTLSFEKLSPCGESCGDFPPPIRDFGYPWWMDVVEDCPCEFNDHLYPVVTDACGCSQPFITDYNMDNHSGPLLDSLVREGDTTTGHDPYGNECLLFDQLTYYEPLPPRDDIIFPLRPLPPSFPVRPNYPPFEPKHPLDLFSPLPPCMFPTDDFLPIGSDRDPFLMLNQPCPPCSEPFLRNLPLDGIQLPLESNPLGNKNPFPLLEAPFFPPLLDVKFNPRSCGSPPSFLPPLLEGLLHHPTCPPLRNLPNAFPGRKLEEPASSPPALPPFGPFSIPMFQDCFVPPHLEPFPLPLSGPLPVQESLVIYQNPPITITNKLC